MRRPWTSAACSDPMTGAAIIDLADVAFRWSGRASFSLHVPAFSVDPGQSVLLLGDSGSGKSTLLSLICGTVLADSGAVCVNGTDLASLSGWSRDRFRAEQIGVIFQQFNLLPFGANRKGSKILSRTVPKGSKLNC